MENQKQLGQSSEKQQKQIVFGAIFVVLVLIAGLVFSIWFLLQDGPQTELIKNIMVIILGAELVLIAAATIILVIQISKLANLMKNEIKPVLEAANETMNTVRGTAAFMSDQVVEPVIKVNSFYAGIRKVFGIFTKD